MATTTVFGTGGWDPFTSYGESMMNLHFQGKAVKQTLSKQYKYAKKYALNGPSWAVQGLRNANLNPILAATDGSFASPTVPSISSLDTASTSSNNVDPSIIVGLRNQTKQTNSQVDLQRAQAFKAFVEGLNELKTNGFKTDTFADISNLASSLGFRDNEIQSILKAYGFDGLSKSTPEGSTTPVPVVKQQHHPLDSTHSDFKPNWSDKTAPGRFFNKIDKQIHEDRKERAYKKFQEAQKRNSSKVKKPYKHNQSNPPSLWFR